MKYTSPSRILLLLIMLLAGTSKKSNAQIITTIAGTPTVAGHTGDGGPATTAHMGAPIGLCLDSLGNLFIGFPNERWIRKVDTAHIIWHIAGNGSTAPLGDGGPASAAALSAVDLAFDQHGCMYIADQYRVRKIDTSGNIYTIAGDGTAGYSGDGGPATAAKIVAVTLAVDRIGNIFIGDDNFFCIRKIDTAGIITTVAGTGSPGYTGDGGPATAARLYMPAGIKVDRSGNIFFSDRGKHTIRKISSTGIITTIAGNGTQGFSGDGGPATAAMLARPQGIALDSAGNLYFSDGVNYRVRKIDRLGIISTVAGTGTSGFSGDGWAATAAMLSWAWGVTIDKCGNLYIADALNYCIRYIGLNKRPLFVGGHVLTIDACINTPASLDAILTAIDTDSTQRLTWSSVSSPLHGTCSVAYSATSTGLPLMPSGLYYTPAAGYTGGDTFMVTVSDGQFSDTAVVYVTVTNLMPYAGSISGTDSVCIGDTLRLYASIAGGAWSSSIALATVNATGLVRGIATGIDTIRYVVTNPCGADTAVYPVYVRRWSDCPNKIAGTTPARIKVSIYPNPNTHLLRIAASVDVRLVLCFADGRTAMEFNKVSEADISALPGGLYTAIVYDMQGSCLLVEKVLKQ